MDENKWLGAYVDIVEEYQREAQAAYDEYEKRVNGAITKLFDRKTTLHGMLVEDGIIRPGDPSPWLTREGDLSVYRRMVLERQSE